MHVDRHGDSQRLAPGLDRRLLFARCNGRLAVPVCSALVFSRLPAETPVLFDKTDQPVHGYSAVWCWMISRPNRSSSELAEESSRAVNSNARAAGWPLRKTGSGEADW